MSKKPEDLDKKAQVLVSLEAMLDEWDPRHFYGFKGTKQYGAYHNASRKLCRACKNKEEISIADYLFKNIVLPNNYPRATLKIAQRIYQLFHK